MQKILVYLLSSLLISGCTIPASATYAQIYSLSRIEKKVKTGTFGTKKRVVLLKDFREDELYEEDYTAAKDAVEKYIAGHPELNDVAKNNLRELKVTAGQSKQEVSLLLGEPDKISAATNQEVWIYRINRLRAFTLFIFPVFFAHEGYYLYFQGNLLSRIERHYPRQIIHQASGAGLSPQLSGPKK